MLKVNVVEALKTDVIQRAASERSMAAEPIQQRLSGISNKRLVHEIESLHFHLLPFQPNGKHFNPLRHYSSASSLVQSSPLLIVSSLYSLMTLMLCFTLRKVSRSMFPFWSHISTYPPSPVFDIREKKGFSKPFTGIVIAIPFQFLLLLVFRGHIQQLCYAQREYIRTSKVLCVSRPRDAQPKVPAPTVGRDYRFVVFRLPGPLATHMNALKMHASHFSIPLARLGREKTQFRQDERRGMCSVC